MIMYTQEMMVNFAMRHRRNKVFKRFSTEQVWETIANAIAMNAFVFATDEKSGAILGLVVGEPNHEAKMMRIRHILTIKPKVIRALMEKFMQMFPGWTITANRKGKEVCYDTRRLERLLTV